MIKIDLLKNHPEVIPLLSNIWHEVFGKIWMPEMESLYYEELNQDIPLTYVALYGDLGLVKCCLMSQLRKQKSLVLKSFTCLLLIPQYQRTTNVLGEFKLQPVTVMEISL